MNQLVPAEYYFITKINEPQDNCLEFEVFCGMLSEEQQNVTVGELDLGPAREISPDPEKKYKVIFEDYIGYSVLDESFDAGNSDDDFSGNNPRVYEASSFLNYIKEDTFASPDYPGEFKHYMFISVNHIVNIASVSEPKILKLV